MRCGHGAFVMLAGMYFMTDVVLLRVLGIIANSLDMAYCFKVAAQPLWLNIGWGALYVVINAYQLYVIYSETASVDMDAELSEMYRTHFQSHGITQQQFRKLVNAARKVTFARGEAIQTEGQPAEALVLMAKGSASISEKGVQVATVDTTFVGSLALLGQSSPAQSTSSSSSSADAATSSSTATTTPPTYQATFAAASEVVAWVWNTDELNSLLAANPSLELSVRAMLHDELLKFNKGALAYARIGSYTQLLRGVTVDGRISVEERTLAQQFRARAGITPDEHCQCLAAVGWSEAQWQSGKGPRSWSGAYA